MSAVQPSQGTLLGPHTLGFRVLKQEEERQDHFTPLPQEGKPSSPSPGPFWVDWAAWTEGWPCCGSPGKSWGGRRLPLQLLEGKAPGLLFSVMPLSHSFGKIGRNIAHDP